LTEVVIIDNLEFSQYGSLFLLIEPVPRKGVYGMWVFDNVELLKKFCLPVKFGGHWNAEGPYLWYGSNK
jgi:hypothetical protein